LQENGLLYIILDKEVTDQHNLNILTVAQKLAASNADFIQLRWKTSHDEELLELAQTLALLFEKNQKVFLVNDRPDIALRVKAAGVHLGRSDTPVTEARTMLGKMRIIGKTTHSMDELVEFSKEDTNYISIGPLFPTQTKPGLKPFETPALAAARGERTAFAIGGITLSNLNEVLAAGVKNIAVCRAVLLKTDIIDAVNKFKTCLNKVS